MSRQTDKAGAFPARLWHGLQARCRKMAGGLWRTLKKPKWRHGGYGLAVLAVLAAAATLLNIGVKDLEDNYGWRRDFSFNGYTSTSAETEKVVASLASPVDLYLLYQSGEMDSQLYEVLARYGRLSDRVRVKPTDIAKNPGLLTRFQGEVTKELAADNVIVSCEATGRYKVLGYDDFVTQGYNMEKGTFEIAGLAYEKSLTEALVYVTQAEVPVVGL